MSTAAPQRTPRLTAVIREKTTVTPLELFFDLVFVLAITQCTVLMADDPTWSGLVRGLLVLGVLWWSWVGYAWLTSLVDPEEGTVRIAIFASMAGLLVAALCVPDVYGDAGLLFAFAYGAVRVAHIALFMLGARGDAQLRRSVTGLGVSTLIGVSLLGAASFADGELQGALWAAALLLDMAGPFFFGAEGWKLVPGHFAERHGLILIIALGESIVAIGAGVEGAVDAGVVASAVLGVAAAAAMWWLYFDVTALAGERRLARDQARRARNELARDAYSYLHLPMIAGIVLVALGMKKTVGHPEDALKLVPAVALFGGAAVYLLAHVGFRLRLFGRLSRDRLAGAVVAAALIPLATEIPALASLASLAALLALLIAIEDHRFAEFRDRMRHELAHESH